MTDWTIIDRKPCDCGAEPWQAHQDDCAWLGKEDNG